MTTYVCVELVNNACNSWVQAQSFLPELTDDARDQILIYIVSTFALVFVVKRVIRLFGG